MLRTASQTIHELLAKAAHARELACAFDDVRSRAFWFTMERQWLSRARIELEIAATRAARRLREMPRGGSAERTQDAAGVSAELQRDIPDHKIQAPEIQAPEIPTAEIQFSDLQHLEGADIKDLDASETCATVPDAETEAQMEQAGIFVLSPYRDLRKRT
jgi:hypothetical protein